MADPSDKIPAWLKKAQAWAEDAGTKAKANLDELSEQLQVQVQGATQKLQGKAAEAAATAQKLVASLANAPADLDNPTALAMRLLEALESVKGQLDREAQAVALGYFKGAGAGVTGLSGTEIFYVRPDGPMQASLRVSQVVGREARLSVGASAEAYVACLYGPREVLARPARRRGADVEALVASLAFLRLEANDKKACGYMAGISAGLGLGLPILSNFGAFEFEEQPIGGVKLSAEISAPLEKLIKEAEDRSWRRRIAQAL
ncbi:MAG: hypothetical protein KC933_00540 [Myxococcales bacterium]|nr:hypothetical protein [Myxococcales bacterium]MCB9648979.1 hypothetical protein [Deltaproteobacteria bacterium]